MHGPTDRIADGHSRLWRTGTAAGWCRRLGAGFWHLLLRNRLAVALASLLWLLWRSGSQPRRLSYPCQQAAVLNLGAFVAGLVPALFLARRPACPRAMARAAGVRRQLLIGGIMAVTAFLGIEAYQFAAPPAAPQWPVLSDPPGDPPPAVVGIHRRDPQGASYTPAEIEAMVRQAVALSGGVADLMTDRNSDGQIHVVIKPNLVQSKWTGTSGVVTDPRVVAAVVKIVKEAGAGKVTVAEGTADGDLRNSTWTAFRNAGYDTNSDRKFDYDTSVDLFDLNDSGGTNQTDPNKVTLVTIPNGVIRTQYWVPNILLQCDVLINVPTFKNHFNGTVTLSLKNRVGCAPNDIYHYPGLSFTKWALVHSVTSGFPCTVAPCPSAENDIVQRTLVDLNLVRPQDLAVIDALIGVTNGPNNDPPTYPNPRMRMIVAGRDSLAVDTVCTLAMAYDPDQVPQLAWAASTGALGTKDRRYITVLGDHVAQVRSSFPEGYGGTTPAVRCDLAAPWIGGMTPAEGQQVHGVVPVTVSGVGDNIAPIKAELFVDGVYQSTDTAAPFSFDWNTAGLPEGPHTIRVTVYDAALNEASMTRNVTIAEPSPQADFLADPVAGPAPLAVQFTDQSSVPGAFSWHWDFGDGTTSGQQNPAHVYQVEGAFTVRLTVTGSGGPVTATKPDLITVASFPKVAFIGGEASPTAADGAIMNHLTARGLVVNYYDDERANRPTAAEIAANHDLVLASSTVLSGNVGGDFRHQAVPLVFWEPSLAWYASPDNRECLANGPSTFAGQTQIDVLTSSHPIMDGISTGTVTVLNAPETLSYCAGTVATGAQVLASAAGNPGLRVVIAAEAGAPLLDGGTAAARRAMLYLYDQTWLQTNAVGRKIFDNAIDWALGGPQAAFTADVTTGPAPLEVAFADQSGGPVTSWTWNFGDGAGSRLRHPRHVYARPGTYTVSLTAGGPVGQPDTEVKTAWIVVGAPRPGDLNIDGRIDTGDLAILEACSAAPAVPYDPQDLPPGCDLEPDAQGRIAADLDDDGTVGPRDFAVLQRCYGDPQRPQAPGCAD